MSETIQKYLVILSVVKNPLYEFNRRVVIQFEKRFEATTVG